MATQLKTTPAVYIVKSGASTMSEYAKLSAEDKEALKSMAREEMQALGIEFNG